MCLYPKRIRNPRYLPNMKNHYNAPVCTDGRLKYIDIPCGLCYECRKQKANSWKFRLQQEINNKSNNNKFFVTLTFSDERLAALAARQKKDKNATERDNGIAKDAVKLWRERWRKLYGKSPKHWLVTELGEEYGRIHLHGIIFEENTAERLDKTWQYGFVYIGEYVNEKTINYIVKYIFKTNEQNRLYTPIVLSSPGIGKSFCNTYDFKTLSVNKTKIRLKNGSEIEAPTYYKAKALTDEQKVQLAIKNIEKNETWIDGIKYANDETTETLRKTMREQAANRYNKIGYLSEYEILMIQREKKRKKK